MPSSSLVRLFASTGLLLGGLVSGCAFDSGPPPGQGPTPNPPGATQPMVVVVDTGKTLAATPGDGVGLFVEYSAGGTWHVWWSCDTNRSGQSCPFAVTIDAASPVSNVVGENLTPDKIAQPSATRLQTSSTVSYDLAGLRFQAVAGERITVTASMGGLQSGEFLFFVQDGQINGGYTGTLTNPLTFEPKTP
jgi:hypothetical protein